MWMVNLCMRIYRVSVCLCVYICVLPYIHICTYVNILPWGECLYVCIFYTSGYIRTRSGDTVRTYFVNITYFYLFQRQLLIAPLNTDKLSDDASIILYVYSMIVYLYLYELFEVFFVIISYKRENKRIKDFTMKSISKISRYVYGYIYTVDSDRS